MKQNKEYPLTTLFIEKLKERMKREGVKRNALAKLVGVSKQYANFWFTIPRKRNMNGETVLKIQDIFKKE